MKPPPILLLALAGAALVASSSSSKKPAAKTIAIPDTDRSLDGVSPVLVAVLDRARGLGARFRVIQGARTVAQQKALIESGASKWSSPPELAPHVRGMAVDIWALPDPEDWQAVLAQARTVAKAAEAEGARVRWGGAWEILSTAVDPAKQAEAYVAKKKAEGSDPFVDPAHFELV